VLSWLPENQDVIRSFFAPSPRFKQNAVPGREGVTAWFAPAEDGRWVEEQGPSA
jgi:heme/copper-type cytochrome/quinol oxidase subunit 2